MATGFQDVCNNYNMIWSIWILLVTKVRGVSNKTGLLPAVIIKGNVKFQLKISEDEG